ncbi:MAG: DUF2202 domain-containing protein, partial [Gammaproteobacteria bacterium]
MGNLNKSIIAGFSALTIVLSICPASATDAVNPANSDDTATLDFNEKTHLIFMCEEEKLARDVYITLGTRYPDSAIFGRIDDSEERHKCAVADMLEKYEIPNPSTNDNVGVFTGEDYGWYFTEKFNALVERGSVSVL